MVAFYTSPLAVTNKYFYQNDIWQAGTSLSPTQIAPDGISNPDVAIWAGGRVDGSTLSARYVFATDSVGPGSNIYTGSYFKGGVGNSIVGLFAGGFTSASVTSNQVTKYVFQTDIVTRGTNIINTNGIASCGCYGISTAGYFAGGVDALSTTAFSSSSVYYYGSDTSVNSVTLSNKQQNMGGNGDTTKGITAGGWLTRISPYTTLSSSNRHFYATDIVTSGTNLSVARGFTAGGQSSPASF